MVTLLRVAVDFGTSSTAAGVSLRGGPPQVVVIDGAPLMPSAVYAAPEALVDMRHSNHGDDAGRDLLPDQQGQGGCWVGCGAPAGRLPSAGRAPRVDCGGGV